MKNRDETKEQLVSELAQLRQRVAQLEDSGIEHKRMEEALRERKEQLQSIFNNAAVGIAVVDGDGCFTDFNETWCRMLGYSRQELLNLSIRDITPVGETVLLPGEDLGENKYHRVEKRYIRKDRSEFWGDLCAGVIHDRHGHVAGMAGIIVDITGRKRAEEALKKAEREKEIILDSQLEHVIYQDTEHRILWPNRAACDSVEMTREELVGRYCYEIWQKLDERCDNCPVALAMETGQRQEVEKTTPDGRAWFMRGYPVRDVDGELVGAIEIAREITEQVRAEDERERLLEHIQEQAQRMRQILDTVPEGVLLLDAAGRIVLANPLAEEYLAILADASVGDILTHLGDRSLAELLTSLPRGLWHEVATGGRTFQVIARTIEAGPTPGGWVQVVRDVTRERAIERRTQQQERLAAVGQLAAGIAHDFNNVMATIILYAQMASRSSELSSRDRERLATINQQAKHATRLIRQILDFSRRAVLERRPLDLVPLMKEQVRLLERTLPENIEVGFAYGADEHTVSADPTRIQQAMVNLALNAWDAMPEGGELRFELDRIRFEDRQEAPLPEMVSGEWVRITVSDTGVGISPDALSHIFDPFFTTKAPGQGSGLGLAQVYGIVMQHEGQIDVKGQLDHGTTFTIYLPALSKQPAEAPALETPPLARGQKETILVVEDSTATRKALVDSLKQLNYRVLEAANGREALAALEQHGKEIKLVLSDVVMPGMSGITLLHTMREKGVTVNMVMLTGHPLEKKLEDLRAHGMIDWLLKPPSLEQLAAVVAKGLGE